MQRRQSKSAPTKVVAESALKYDESVSGNSRHLPHSQQRQQSQHESVVLNHNVQYTDEELVGQELVAVSDQVGEGIEGNIQKSLCKN